MAIKEVIDRFDAIGQRWIDDVTTVKPSDVPNTLYHYTNAAGLHGMLSNNAVWLTDSRFLNDKTEGSHYIDLAKGLVLDRKSKTRAKAAGLFYDGIIERLPGLSGNFDAYIFSLSDKEDDLSQWRGYAAEGSGFTVGFSGPDIHNHATEDQPYYHFGKIEYDHDRQLYIIGSILDELEKQLVKELARSDHPGLEEVAKEAAKTYVWTLDNRSAFSKHRSFSGEGEWRMVIYKDAKSTGTLVRTSSLGLVPYLSVEPAGAKTKLPITRIGIGPGFADSQVSIAVEALCLQTGYEPKYYFADTPYRRP